MLLDLLINAGLAARDTLFGQLLRWIDRSVLIMAEEDARAEGVIERTQEPGVQ
jgi:hypothetical protein